MSADTQVGETVTDDRLEQIPDELKERDQWLLWDTESDRKQPHWNGSYSISWSDPDDWHSFDEAIECAAKRESWYIGYVCAVENTDFDGDYGVIDLDGVVNDDGEIVEWLPPLDRFYDAMTFMEFSGSGTGIHIPFKGEVPSWWRDGQVGDHEGIDVLANKFCAFTGDTLEESGSGIADINVTPWLLEAYEAIHGEYPNSIRDDSPETQSNSNFDGDWLTDNLVREALDFIDPDIGYNDWRDIAFAVHDYDDGWFGQSIFKEWSEGGNKYDETAERQIERLWKKTDKGGGITVATLIHKAREAGWSPDVPTSLEREKDGEDGHLKTHIGVSNGQYGYEVYDDDIEDYRFKPISTFTLQINAFLDDPDTDGELFDLTVVPASDVEGSFDMTVSPSVFNDIQKFKNNVCKGRTTTFSGGYDDLDGLRIRLGQQDAPERVGTRKIGIHDDKIVTPNGVYDADWNSNDPKYRYINSGAQVEEKWALGDDGDYDTEEVALVCELISQIRDTERWYPAIGWFYSSAVTHWIRDWEGEMPMLTVTGDAGSGKSGSIEILHEIMGLDGNPHGPKDTKFAQIKLLSSTTNLPIWYDEYKPNELSKYQKDQFQDLIRRATRGADETRGNADQSVTTYRLEPPIVISGEQAIQGNAEERRSIRTQFRKATTRKTDCKRAFAELTGGSYEDEDGVHYCDGHDLRECAKAIHQYILTLDKEEAHNVWKESKKHIHNILSEEGIGGVGDLEQQSLQMIKFGMTIYRHFGDQMGADLSHVTDEDIDAAITYIAHTMGDGNRTSHVDEFIGLLGAAINDGVLYPNRDFAIVHEGEPNEELRIKMERAHHAVSKYVQEHGLTGYDLLNKANDYKGRMSDLTEDDGSYVLGVSVNTRGLNRCVAIDTHRAEEVVEGFDRESILN